MTDMYIKTIIFRLHIYEIRILDVRQQPIRFNSHILVASTAAKIDFRRLCTKLCGISQLSHRQLRHYTARLNGHMIFPVCSRIISVGHKRQFIRIIILHHL